jgi:hypothetical protein
MPRSRGRGGRRNPPPLPPSPPKQLHLLLVACNFLKSLGRTLARATIALSALVGLVAGGLFLLPPRVTVESLAPFDASDALSTSFVIKNAWILSLDEVQAFLGICEFRASPQITIQGNCAHPGATPMTAPPWKPHHLDVDEKFSIVIGEVWNTPAATFSGGDITVVVTFKPWISPFRQGRQFRFVASKQRDGKFYWSPQAIDAR